MTKKQRRYTNLTIPCREGNDLSRQVRRDVRYIMAMQGFTSTAQALRYAVITTAALLREGE